MRTLAGSLELCITKAAMFGVCGTEEARAAIRPAQFFPMDSSSNNSRASVSQDPSHNHLHPPSISSTLPPVPIVPWSSGVVCHYTLIPSFLFPPSCSVLSLPPRGRPFAPPGSTLVPSSSRDSRTRYDSAGKSKSMRMSDTNQDTTGAQVWRRGQAISPPGC